jgi:hypothetical protein
MPRFFAELGLNANSSETLFAAVHDSQTGQQLSQISVPGVFGTSPNIAADGSDRTFIINATRPTPNGKNGVTALYRLRVAADGQSEKLTRLPVNLLPAGSNDVVDGIAVSPDGTSLAVGLQLYKSAAGNSLDSHGEIALYSLTGGPTRTWTAPGDATASPWSLVRIGASKLAFVWQDQLKGSAAYFFTGRSQIRVLDTSAPGHDLLASRVLLQGGGKLGFIQSAGVGPDGSPINVAANKCRLVSPSLQGSCSHRSAQILVQASVSTLRRICSISSKCSCVQVSGGESCTTGSPRSSARQIRPASKRAWDMYPRSSRSDSSSSKVSLVALSFTSSMP